MNYLLHIDTSADTGVIALSRDGIPVAQRLNEESRNHAATINIMIEEVMKEADITLPQLSGIVVCAGPGSYTGLRIGLATAKGLCYALDKSLLLDNKLTLLANTAYHRYQRQYQQYIAILIAREREYFIAIYDNAFKEILSPRHITDSELNTLIDTEKSTYVITNTPANVINTLDVKSLVPDNNIKVDLGLWCAYAYEQFKCNSSVNLSLAEPFYLKQVYTHK